MKRFLIAFFVGIVSAVVAAFLSFLYLSQVNLGCRDCQGAAGMLVLVFYLVVGFFFLTGFLIAFFRKRR